MWTTTGTRAQTPRRLRALTAIAGVTVLGLAGCGSSAPRSAAAGESSAKAVSTPSVAASTAVSVGGASSSATSSASSSAKTSGSSAGTPNATELTLRVASASKAKGTARLAMTPGTTGQRATGAMRFKRSGVDFAIVMGLPGGKTMKMVVVGGTAYMNVGEKYQGKNWIRIVPGGSDPLSKALGPMLTQLGTGLDLDTQLAGVKDAKITGASRTTLGGEPVTKYTLVSGEKALLAQVDKLAPTPELRSTLRSEFKGAHGESVMWIGADNLPRRADSRVVGGKVPGTTSTVTYSDWGKPVSISAPPAGDTVNVAG
jgi:hypothetical protein